MNNLVKNLFLGLIIAVVLVIVFSNLSPRHHALHKVTYSEFLQKVKTGNVASVTIEDREIEGILKDNSHITTDLPSADPNLLFKLLSQKVKVVGKAPQQQSFFMHTFINWFPMLLLIGSPVLLLIGVWIFFKMSKIFPV